MVHLFFQRFHCFTNPNLKSSSPLFHPLNGVGNGVIVNNMPPLLIVTLGP